jgi:hypothetical protein
MKTGDTKTFVESNTLKSGNTKLIDKDGNDFYLLAESDIKIALNIPTSVTWRTEVKGDKTVNIIESIGSVVPSLPKTAVQDTKAPGGESPVAPAKKDVKKTFDKPSYGGDYQKPWLPEEAHRVAILNILTATLMSPAVGQAVVGRNPEEVAATIRDTFTKSVALYTEKVQTIEQK